MIPITRREFTAGMAATLSALNTSGAIAGGSRRVIVVGAGIMGASIAYHLARRGAQVTILEKAKPAAGATQGSFAWINAYGKNPASYYELNLAGLMGWRRLALEMGSALQIQWGGSVQWTGTEDKAGDLRAKVMERERLGYPVRLIGRDELTRLLPGVEPGVVAGASFAEIEATVDPLRATVAMLAQARKAGASLVHPCEVLSMQAGSGRIDGITTSHGKITADHYVLAAGYGVMELARQVGVEAPLTEGSGVLAHSKPLPYSLNRVVLLPELSIKQNPDGRIVAGFHFAGTRRVEPTAEVGERILREATRFFPKLRQAKLDFVTLGKPAMRKDGLPVAGMTRKYGNLFVAAMNSGVTLAPIIGQLAGIEILDGVPTDMLDPYRV